MIASHLHIDGGCSSTAIVRKKGSYVMYYWMNYFSRGNVMDFISYHFEACKLTNFSYICFSREQLFVTTVKTHALFVCLGKPLQ